MFNEEKTTALTRMILGRLKVKCPYRKAIKLLYLMDRYMIEHYNDVITQDMYVSMRYGPVLSNTLTLIRGDNSEGRNGMYKSAMWDKYIKTENNNIDLTDESKPDPSDILTKQELDSFDAIMNKFGDKDQWDLVEYTHKHCPEWKDPAPFGVAALPIQRILRQFDKPEAIYMKFASRDTFNWDAIF